MEGESIWLHLNRQVFLGGDAFIAGAHQRTARRPTTSTFRVRSADLQQPLDAITKAHPDRDTTMRAAWATR
jgi:hypothetical protein